MRKTLALVGQEPDIPFYTGHLEGRLAEDLRAVSRKRVAELITGGLSSPGKMPCPSIGISAQRCKTGSRLAEVLGSVCHPSVCYAKKRNYARETVQGRLEARYEGLSHPLWTPAMIFLINYYCDEYFRMFDSGDLQSENHYKNIITVAKHTPDVKIWMPTREIGVLLAVHREMAEQCIEFPMNLIPRVSANMIDGPIPKGFKYTSRVVTDPEQATCIAQKQKNKCDGEIDNCRACWNADNVDYPLH